MSRLLIATTNPAKLGEYRRLLSDYALDPVSLSDVGIEGEPDETGATLEENALLKARYYFERAQLPTLADDGGLEVDALGGEPGVRSHRWLEGVNDDRALVDEVIRRMANVEDGRRTARLRNALALVYRVGGGEVRERVVAGTLEGEIPRRAYPVVPRGFPYRAVLFLPERGCYLAELGEEEQARLSQRRIAVENARPYLLEIAAGG